MSTAEELYRGKRKWIDIFKRGWDHTIQQRRYARLYFGLNAIRKEYETPIGVHSIPLPFATKNHALVRYKKLISAPHYDGYKIRCDQEIKRLESLKARVNDRLATSILDGQLDILNYIANGPYDPNRGGGVNL